MQNPANSFFQSSEFGEFQKQIPHRGKVWFVLAGTQNTPSAVCLAIKQKLPLSHCWLWSPYCPAGFSKEFFGNLERIAREEKAIFARIEPAAGWTPKDTALAAQKWRAAKAKNRYTPEHSLVLNISKSEEKILAQMKSKGRYNIKTAARSSIVCKHFNPAPARDFDDFYRLMKSTGERDQFGIHPKYFYEKLLAVFGPKHATLFLAYKKDKVIAGIIVIFYKDTATYYYGASDYKHRNLMAPYLLQWTAILEAKKRNMKFYDFLGIAPEEQPNHPWRGITEFKKKFGGCPVRYPPAFDIVYRPLQYGALNMGKKLKKIFF